MNTYEIQQFHFPVTGETVRTVITDANGAPWFVAKDVCDILDIKNSRDALSGLEADEKGVALTDTPGGKQRMTTVSESGLYALIVRSRKPEAVQFRRWVTGEVLPMIRKTGMYMHESIYQKLIDDPKRLGQILLDYGRAKDELEETRERLSNTEVRLDHAIKTKAEISDKKTATAMATASKAVRELNAYKRKYEGSPMRTVSSQMSNLTKYFRPIGGWFPASLIGKELRAISERLGLRMDHVADERYGQVNRYHVDVSLETVRAI